jgi:hypothetical protein
MMLFNPSIIENNMPPKAQELVRELIKNISKEYQELFILYEPFISEAGLANRIPSSSPRPQARPGTKRKVSNYRAIGKLENNKINKIKKKNFLILKKKKLKLKLLK